MSAAWTTCGPLLSANIKMPYNLTPGRATGLNQPIGDTIMHELKARFATSQTVVERAISDERETNQETALAYWHETSETGHMIVMGRAQAVMFLIGRLAAQGEDGLISVKVVS